MSLTLSTHIGWHNADDDGILLPRFAKSTVICLTPLPGFGDKHPNQVYRIYVNVIKTELKIPLNSETLNLSHIAAVKPVQDRDSRQFLNLWVFQARK